MSRVSHRHVCKYVDSFITHGNKLNLIMEYCEQGDLEQYLKRAKDMRMQNHPVLGSGIYELGEAKVWRIFIQICLALEFIHEKGIVHADLKPPNLLLKGRDYVLKLTDFGISQKLSPGHGFSYDCKGTLPYCSPEVLKGQPYNQKTDVWALGCILYELIACKRAYEIEQEAALKQRILSYQIPQFSKTMSTYASIQSLSDVYNLCMQRYQEDRPSVSEILSLDIV